MTRLYERGDLHVCQSKSVYCRGQTVRKNTGQQDGKKHYFPAGAHGPLETWLLKSSTMTNGAERTEIGKNHGILQSFDNNAPGELLVVHVAFSLG